MIFYKNGKNFDDNSRKNKQYLPEKGRQELYYKNEAIIVRRGRLDYIIYETL